MSSIRDPQAINLFGAVYNHIRRRYWNATTLTWDVVRLRELAEQAFQTGTEEVTITSTSSQAGGTASGEVTFDKLTLLAAIEALLIEADPTGSPPPPTQQTQATFRRCNSPSLGSF